MDRILAAVMNEPGGGVEIREFPLPDLEPDSALLGVELSEVCGTDVHLLNGRLAGVPYPIIPGHVAAGRLARIRGRMRDVEGRELAEGDRVTFLDVHRTCNACWFCLVAKATTRCPQRKVYGITYGLGDGILGGWSTGIHLKPGVRCLRLEADDSERFMAGGCAVPTSLHAIERAEIGVGDVVLVLGSGPVGLSAVALARLQGAGRVLCVGAPENRLAVARRMGADATIDIEKQDERARLAWVHEETDDRGADVAIEATGDPRAVVQAMRYVRDAGRVVVVGQYTDQGEVPFNPHADLNRKHLEVRGCWGSDFSHFHRAVKVLENPLLSAPWAEMPTRRFALREVEQALDEVAAGRVVKALVDPAL